MKSQDLRAGIIPTRLKNNDYERKTKKEYDTTDLIYLDSYEEQFEKNLNYNDRMIPATDHAKIHNVFISNDYKSKTGEHSCWWWLRSAYNSYYTYFVNTSGDWNTRYSRYQNLGLRPALHYNLPSNISARSAFRIFNREKSENKSDDFEFDVRHVKDEDGNTIYHCLLLGERSITKADEELSNELESLYHGGKLKEGIIATGRWYTDNGQKGYKKDFAGVHSPEFEYKGNKYVREISYPEEDSTSRNFTDGTKLGKAGRVIWIKVDYKKLG